MTSSLFSSYQITETLYQEEASALYRASHRQDQSRFLLRVVKTPPGEKLIHELHRDLEIASHLECISVLKPSHLETYTDATALIHPDFAGKTLTRAFKGGLDFGVFFDLAIEITQALENLHSLRFVHRALSPDKILVSSDGTEVRFIGLGFASHAFRNLLVPASQLNLPLAYISPEQTGRVGRTLDERSDLYSLGVIFYEMLAGRLPFLATDPVGWAHCHIAREPVSPLEFQPEIPHVLASIVMKLLAKEPHARYQSALGLRRDLERSRNLQHQPSRLFTLGHDDLPSHIVIPEQLYGRERERARLVNAFADVKTKERTALALVSGPTGVGKTALSFDFQSEVLLDYGLFVSGKFDASKRDTPCSALLDAVRELVLHMLTESDAAFHNWKEEVQRTLGEDLPFLVACLPELGELFPAISQNNLSPFEKHTRLSRAILMLLSLHAQSRHPLVLHLEDLQWADTWSLDVVRALLVEKGSAPLLIVGSFREDELFEAHPLRELERYVLQKGVSVTAIPLEPLRATDMEQWVSDMLRRDKSETEEFSLAIYHATQGLPLFVQQLVLASEQEKILWVDRNEKRWRWNTDALTQLRAVAESPEFFVHRLHKCSQHAQRFLEVLACYGLAMEPAHARTLVAAGAGDADASTLNQAVQEAEDRGFIVQVDPDLEKPLFRFAHERIRQAIWVATNSERRQHIHLGLARSLIHSARNEDHAARIAFHYQQAEKLVTDSAERMAAAQWHLHAGRRAKDATSYEIAYLFFKEGVQFLLAQSWENAHDFTFTLFRELAECEYLCAHYEMAEERFAMLLEHVRSPLERAQIFNLRVLLMSQKYKFAEAVQAALDGLEHLGMPLFQAGTDPKVALATDTAFINQALPKLLTQNLEDRPAISDEKTLMALDILQNLFVPAYNSDVIVNLLSVARITRIHVEHGNSKFAPFAFMAQAVALACERRFDEAFSLGKMALHLNNSVGDRSLRSRLFHMFGCWISPWKAPQQNSPNWFATSYLAGTETGDLVFAGCAIMIQVIYDVILSEKLDELEARWKSYPEFLEKVRHERPLWTLRISQQFLRCMGGHTESPASLSDEKFDEEAFLSYAREANLNVAEAWYWLVKIMLLVFTQRFQEALALCKTTLQMMTEIAPATLLISELRFFEGLAQAGLGHRDGLLEPLADYRIWSAACPENFESAFLILQAQADCLEGRHLHALKKLECAAQCAHKNRQGLHEALAFEMAATLCNTEGLGSVSEMFAQKAHESYATWGATVRCAALEAKFPYLKTVLRTQQKTQESVPSLAISSSQGWSGHTEIFDIQSIFKATQTLSQEMMLDRVLLRLMNITIENSGAQRGILILFDENSQPKVELEGILDAGRFEIGRKNQELMSFDAPHALINYAQHRLEPVLILDAQRDALLRGDPYVQRHRSRSMLCLPIRRKEKILGHLVLENGLMSGAFTQERLGFLSHVMSQAAISIENARLYSSLHESETRLRAVFESITEALLVVDAHGAPLMKNEAALQVFAHNGCEPLRRPVYSELGVLAGENLISAQEQPLTRALAGNIVRNEEYLLKNANNGRDARLCISAAPLYDAQQQISGGVLLALDVTGLRELDQLKDQFLRVVAHELKTPLGIIKGYSELLGRKAQGQPGLDHLLSSIENGVNSLSNLVNNLIDVSLIQVGRFQLLREQFDLCGLVRTVAEKMTPSSPRHKLELQCICESCIVSGDPARLGQALGNLIENGIKYMPAGGTLTVSCQSQSGTATLSVQDEGVGIPVEKQHRIFECFYRAHTDTPYDYGGIGTGLFLTREIVKLHKGEIWFASEEGRGSKFTFTIPTADSGHGE